MSSHSSPTKTYTLAGSSDWQKSQRSKQITQFSLREREFIKDSLTSEWDEDFTGTRVIYIEPEGSDHMSMISNDDPTETNNSTTANLQNQPNAPGKGKFKKIVKRLYPSKVVGGAKVFGGAIRHPMATSRKVNHFVRRKNAASSSRDTRRPANTGMSENTTNEDLPPLARCATMNEIQVGSHETSPGVSLFGITNSSAKTQKRGILRRRNSAPHLLRQEDNVQIDVNPNGPTFEGEVAPRLCASSQRGSIGSVSSEPTHHLDLNSHSQFRSNISAEMGSSPQGPYFPNFDSAGVEDLEEDPRSVGGSVDRSQAPSQQTIILTDLEEQLRNWSIKSDSKISEDTQSTTASPYISILRHQKKCSEGAVKGPTSTKQFTASELSYLEHVLDAMYKLIVGTALDKSGVQYRNTFAWRYLV